MMIVFCHSKGGEGEILFIFIYILFSFLYKNISPGMKLQMTNERRQLNHS